MNLSYVCAYGSSHLYNSVSPSVGLSVGPSVRPSVRPAFVNTIDNYILELASARGGSLDACSPLYETVCPSIGLSIYRSVRHAFVNIHQNSRFLANQTRRKSIEAHEITSSNAVTEANAASYIVNFFEGFFQVFFSSKIGIFSA